MPGNFGIQSAIVAGEQIDQWLSSFPLDGSIRAHVAAVLQNLPEEVQADLMDDPGFVVYDYDPGLHQVMHVPVIFLQPGKPGRSIVLKRSIKRRSTSFARWVIAHELAHAYLRHGGRYPNEDPELAADSLAADWGFPRPMMW
jgi:hypothetical protein